MPRWIKVMHRETDEMKHPYDRGLPSPGKPTFLRCSVAELRLSSERRDGSVVVTIAGDLDLVTSRRLDEHLKDARRESSWIILDLAGVNFMDTNALAVIVNHWKKAGAAGGILALAGARYQYTRALWITGLASRLPMHDTVDLAVAAGSGPQAPAGPSAPAAPPPAS
jgi:anti-sigma B factor antagonist